MADADALCAGRISLPLRGALAESRQRWRDLVALAGDLAFETDEDGRFTLVMPDPALGWAAAELLGTPARDLVISGPGQVVFDPFCPPTPFRRRRTWLRTAQGRAVCFLMAASPLVDGVGQVVGARGIGTDITDQDAREEVAAAALRRGAVIDEILWRMRQEVLAPRMMRAVLDGLAKAVGAEGAAVIGEGPLLLHQSGDGAGMVLPTAGELLDQVEDTLPVRLAETGGRSLLVCACHTRFGEKAGLALWRPSALRTWDSDDQTLAGSVSAIVRVVLEHHSIQREMARQARTDPLTGLLNRRAFLEELPRHVDRLEREQMPGTLMFADLDNFKAVNDELGHEVGDRVLCRAAQLLRNTFRPTDLVARLGGDEFAVWLNGADSLTAAERAEWLRIHAPITLAELIGSGSPRLGFSIGIAMRRNGEELDRVTRRADLAMYEVKHGGRGHWRVAQE